MSTEKVHIMIKRWTKRISAVDFVMFIGIINLKVSLDVYKRQVLKDETINVDDIIETSNHFRCIDLIIENRSKKLSEAFIKELHRCLLYTSRCV